MGWAVEEFSRNLHRIKFDVDAARSQTFLLMSDVHFDSVDCNREMLKRHLEEAKEREAIVLDNGDFFDAMQSKHDRRADTREIRPEHVGDRERAYFDAILDDAAEFLAPYKDLLAVRGMGNHETAVAKHSPINLTHNLVARLRSMGASRVCSGGFSGFIVPEAQIGGHRESFDLYYHHGAGGGGAVTRGMIQTNRMAATKKADIYWGGHVHEHLSVWTSRMVRTGGMKIENRVELHLRTPGYNDAYGDGYAGHAVEKDQNPKVCGSYWLTFSKKRLREKRATFDVSRAA